MWALVDCNSFFCSVEKVFHSGLQGRPVCVLSSNDGCIVALTPEAKAVGLRRGDPLFKVSDIVERHQVRVFSTNMQLYAAMSKRVTNILRQSIMRVENYSIDESFCDLGGYERHHNLTEMMRDIAGRIRLWTDIPVSVGIAPSKTLAKMGSKFAKQYRGYHGVCCIDSDDKRRRALQLFDLADVWGIGRRTLERLNYYGIHSPLQLADKSEAWVKSHLAKPGVQTWMELNGQPCIDTTEVRRNQTVTTSRSFGSMVESMEQLKSAVATFAASCANKLRGQQAVARQVTVFIASNAFRDDLAQYANAATVTLLTHTADTMEITAAALQALAHIYHHGVMYKRAGVTVSDIIAAHAATADLFDPITNRAERAQLMAATDNINHRYGLKTIRLAAEGDEQQPWKVKCEHRSPNYLTDIRDILVVG